MNAMYANRDAESSAALARASRARLVYFTAITILLDDRISLNGQFTRLVCVPIMDTSMDTRNLLSIKY